MKNGDEDRIARFWGEKTSFLLCGLMSFWVLQLYHIMDYLYSFFKWFKIYIQYKYQEAHRNRVNGPVGIAVTLWRGRSSQVRLPTSISNALSY